MLWRPRHCVNLLIVSPLFPPPSIATPLEEPAIMILKAVKFTPEVLLSAPRRSPGAPNSTGEKVLHTVGSLLDFPLRFWEADARKRSSRTRSKSTARRRKSASSTSSRASPTSSSKTRPTASPHGSARTTSFSSRAATRAPARSWWPTPPSPALSQFGAGLPSPPSFLATNLSH